MQERNQSCSTCRFWEQWVTRPEVSDDGKEARHDQGDCCRMPPVVLNEPVVEHPTYGPLAGSRVVFPYTHATRWCGEWQAANPQTVDDAGLVMARAVIAGDAGAARALADKVIELIPLPVVEQNETQ
jgi:hypothetical protein